MPLYASAPDSTFTAALAPGFGAGPLLVAHRPEPTDPPTPDEPDPQPDPGHEPAEPPAPPIGDPPPQPDETPHISRGAARHPIHWGGARPVAATRAASLQMDVLVTKAATLLPANCPREP